MRKIILFTAASFLLAWAQATDRTITSFAGDGTTGGNGDGGTATAAQLNVPWNSFKDSVGNVYIADSKNHRIRKVSPSGVISTVVGTGVAGFSGDDGPATSAQLNTPTSVIVDETGDLYIGDSENNRIRRVHNGIITTIAGGGTAANQGDNIPALGAGLWRTYCVIKDDAGIIYLVDGNRVRKVGLDGILTTVAGTGSAGFSGDGGAATLAKLNLPASIYKRGDDLYIADTLNNRIRKVSGGIITTVAGNGNKLFAGDNGPATAAALNGPFGVFKGADGNIYIADTTNHRIRQVDTGGTITTIVGGGASTGDAVPALSARLISPSGVMIDSAGDMFITELGYRVRRVTTSFVLTVNSGTGGGSYLPGTTVSVTANAAPSGKTFDKWSGDTAGVTNVFLANTTVLMAAADTTLTATYDLPKYTLTVTNGAGSGNYYAGQIVTITANPPPTGKLNALWVPGPGITVANPLSLSTTLIMPAAAGTVTFTYRDKYPLPAAPGTIVTIAGNGQLGYTGDGWLGYHATLQYPCGITQDTKGNIYFADSHNNVIRKVDPSGVITTFAGIPAGGFGGDGGPAILARLSEPHGISIDKQDNIYIADRGNGRIRKVDTNGIITTVVGMGSGYSGDGGPALLARLNQPHGVYHDGNGNIYIADRDNNAVRWVNAAGIITTLAGSGTGAYGFSGDGGPSTLAKLNSPHSVFKDKDGNIYIADGGNSRIRKIDPAGIITTVVGTGAFGYNGDNIPAITASINDAYGVFKDNRGYLYISDTSNHRIRQVDPSGIITTIAANTGVAGYGGDGGPAMNALVSQPHGIYKDQVGNILIGEWSGLRVRKIFGNFPGDYDRNCVVDDRDNDNVYRKTMGNTVIPLSGADGTGDGIVDAADWVLWRAYQGKSCTPPVIVGSGAGAGSGMAAENLMTFDITPPLDGKQFGEPARSPDTDPAGSNTLPVVNFNVTKWMFNPSRGERGEIELGSTGISAAAVGQTNRPLEARVVIIDLYGREVANYMVTAAAGGRQTVSWDGRDKNGSTVASGVYLGQIITDEKTEKFKLIVAK